MSFSTTSGPEHDGCPDRASAVAAVMVRRRGSPLNSQKTPPRAISQRKFETTLQPRGMTVLPAQVCPRSLAKRASLDVAARARSRMWQKVASKLCRLVTRPRRGRCHLEPVWMSPCAVLCGGSVSSLEGRGRAFRTMRDPSVVSYWLQYQNAGTRIQTGGTGHPSKKAARPCGPVACVQSNAPSPCPMALQPCRSRA